MGSLWHFTDLQCVDFAKNASFKTFGIICLPLLPSILPDELSVDMTNSSGFFSRSIVCTFSDSFSITADSSLFSAIELLSFLACWPAGLAHVVLLHITQLRVIDAICILVVTLYIMHFATQACKYWKQWLCLVYKLNRYMHAIVNAPRVLHFSASFPWQCMVSASVRYTAVSMECASITHKSYVLIIAINITVVLCCPMSHDKITCLESDW